jgi:hypothetical protein
MRIKIRKTIKGNMKSKSKSTTHSPGSLERAMFRPALNLNRTPNLVPNLDLHPTLHLSPGLLSRLGFGHSDFGHSNLFRISCFGFRMFT